MGTHLFTSVNVAMPKRKKGTVNRPQSPLRQRRRRLTPAEVRKLLEDSDSDIELTETIVTTATKWRRSLGLMQRQTTMMRLLRQLHPNNQLDISQLLTDQLIHLPLTVQLQHSVLENQLVPETSHHTYQLKATHMSLQV